MVELIDENKLWDWIQKTHPGAMGLQHEYRNAVSQRINEINWQLTQLDKTQAKLVNLIKDPMGKIMLAYMINNLEQWKELFGKMSMEK